MKKKSQIRKYTVQKVSQLTKQQTIPEMLKLYAQHVQEKKNKLKEKKSELLNQLNTVRKDSQKVVFQMVDGVRDRLQKTQKIILNGQSRPSKDNVKDLSELFIYMQTQTNLIHKNSNQTKQLHDMICSIDKQTTYQNINYSQIDKQFAQLQQQCKREQQIRDKLIQERNSNLEFYKSITQTIDQYRIKYQIVQNLIAQRQKQLDHLVSYFKTRQQQDKQKIQHETNIGNQLESRLLEAQQVLNTNSNKNMNLQIRQNEYSHRNFQQRNQ